MSHRSPRSAAVSRRSKHRDAWLGAGLALAWTIGCSVYDDSLLSTEAPIADAGRGGTVAGGEATAGGGSKPVGGAAAAGTASGSGGFSGKTGVAGEAGAETGEGGAPDGMGGTAATGGITGSAGKAGAAGSAGKGGTGGTGGTGGSSGSGGSAGGSAGAPHELSVGRPATASSFQADHTIAQGNDDNNTSRWAATNNTFPQWWRVDLGATRRVTSVALRPEYADRKYSYLVETSTNDTVYTERRNANGTAAVHTVDLPANVDARYVRITLIASTGGNTTQWASFFEFTVFGN